MTKNESKNMNHMNHIEVTIAELQEGIRVRQDAVNALQKLFPTPAPTTEPAPANVSAPTRQITLSVRKSKPVNTSWSRAPRPAVREACLALTEPFGCEELAKATDLTKSGASSQLYRWAAQGLLQKVAPGKWKRTAKFVGTPTAMGGGEQAPVSVPVSASDAARGSSLEEQIKQACKERDAAVATGRDRIAKILQDKVDKLQRQFELLS